jgi:hypothetical protein
MRECMTFNDGFMLFIGLYILIVAGVALILAEITQKT